MSEVKIDMKMIAAYNKEFIGKVKDFAFFEEGVGVELDNVIKGEVENYGEKIVFDSPIETVIVDKKELKKYNEGDIVRFKKGFNAKFIEINEYSARAHFISYKNQENPDKPIISWLKRMNDTEILMSDGSTKRGISPSSLIKEKGMVHFEGLGYANIEAEGKAVFAYE